MLLNSNTTNLQNTNSIGFCLAAGGRQLGRLGAYCVRSIRRIYTNSNILVFIGENESIPPILKEVDAQLVQGNFPIPDYPISAKVAALIEAENRFETDWLCLLDADTILTKELHIPEESDTGLVPVFVGAQPWGEAPQKEWQSLYDHFGFEYTQYRVKSLLDNIIMEPYFNAGMVLTQDTQFGSKWKDVMVELAKLDLKSSRYIDQIALSLVATQNRLAVMPDGYNFPVFLRIIAPSDSRVLHYRDPRWFLRLPQYDGLLEELGVVQEYPFSRTDPRIIPFLLKSLWINIRARSPWKPWLHK
jgi:hypothetical protein